MVSDTPLTVLVLCTGNAESEACPVFLGSPLKAHWGLPDPADATGSEAEVGAAFEETWRLLAMRVAASLAIDREAMDAAALKEALNAIGRMEGAA